LIIELNHRVINANARAHWFDGHSTVAYSESPVGVNHLLGSSFYLGDTNLARDIKKRKVHNLVSFGLTSQFIFGHLKMMELSTQKYYFISTILASIQKTTIPLSVLVRNLE
jgi:hypothetical protein